MQGAVRLEVIGLSASRMSQGEGERKKIGHSIRSGTLPDFLRATNDKVCILRSHKFAGLRNTFRVSRGYRRTP